MTPEISVTIYLRMRVADEAAFMAPAAYDVTAMKPVKTFAAVGSAEDWLGRRADDVAKHALRLFHNSAHRPECRADLLFDLKYHNRGRSCLHVTVDVHVTADGKRYARQAEGCRFSTPPAWTMNRLDCCLIVIQQWLGMPMLAELVAKIIRDGVGRVQDAQNR